MHVSVIISTYNRAAMLKQAIDSVLNQSYKDFELIVVDDGSTDETPQVIEEYGATVHCISQNNAGLNVGRNKALQQAQGTYIALLDDDDLWEPYKLELQVALMERYPDIPYTFSDFTIFSKEGIVHKYGLQSWFKEPKSWPVIYDDHHSYTKMNLNIGGIEKDFNIFYGHIYSNLLYDPLILPSTSLIRTEAIPENVRFIEHDSLYGDWDFFARLARNNKVLFIDYPTTRNRSHREVKRITQAPPKIHGERRMALIRRVWKADPEFYKKHRKSVDQIEGNLLLEQARYALEESRKTKALSTLKEYKKLRSGNITLIYVTLYIMARLPGMVNLFTLMLYLRRRLLGKIR